MQCEARSCFAYEQLRECTTVHDRSSGVARHEIARNAPPPVVFLLYLTLLLIDVEHLHGCFDGGFVLVGIESAGAERAVAPFP